MYRCVRTFRLLLLLSTLAVAQQKPSTPLPPEETVNAFLQQTFGFDAGLSWKINSIRPSEAEGLAEVDVVVRGAQGPQEYRFYVTPDGKHAVMGDIVPFGARPFEPAAKKLQADMNGPSRGPATAPVTIVEFSDLQCPHCKEAQPALDKLMQSNQNVRLVFQNLPLPMHDWAAKAAAYADCVGRASNDAFWKFVASVYAAQSDITASNVNEKLAGMADVAGAKGTDIAACAAKPETATRIEYSQKLGKELGVDSTPTLFINGRKLPALQYDTLEKLVNFAAKDAK
jgi:protein-disulfide isomerase